MSTNDISDEVVVLPWVPATTMELRSARNSSESRAGKETSGNAALLRRQHLDVVAPAHVAHDHALGAPVEVLGAESGHHRDAELLELGRHGGIDVLVGAAHVVPGGAQQAGQGAHAGSGDAYQVQLHETPMA